MRKAAQAEVPQLVPSDGISRRRAPGGIPAAAAGAHVWLSLGGWWHFVFALSMAATASLTAYDIGSTWRLCTVFALYAGIIAVYAVTRGNARRGRRAKVYLWATAALLVPAIFFYPGTAFLFFSYIPNVFALMELAPAFVAVTGLVLVSAASGLLYSKMSGTDIVTVAIYGSFSLVGSFFLGAFIDRIIHQSAERAALIEKLTSTQAELADANRQKGALDERQRLAREVHDAVAQNFSSVVMLVQAARSALGRGDTTTVEHQLGLAESAAREGLSEARDLIGDLGPLALRSATLAGALERLCQQVARRFDVEVHLDVEGAERLLGSGAEVLLLRSAQGLLANVGQHAHAQKAFVRLAFLPATVALEIEDDGVGFDPALAKGFGTSQLHARAAEMGGSCYVRSAPGAGTLVRIAVPA